MTLQERIKHVDLKPSDIVSFTDNYVSLSLASQWISSFEKDRNLSVPVKLLLERLCNEKEHAISYTKDLTAHQIKKFSKPLTDITGVYFLIDNDEIVYVGQSLNVYSRISAHKKDKDFDKVFVIKCQKEELTEIERYYILLLRPKHNKTHNPDKWAESTKMYAPVMLEVERIQGKVLKPEIENAIIATPTDDIINFAFTGFIKKGNWIYLKWNTKTLYKIPLLNENTVVNVSGDYLEGDFSKTMGTLRKIYDLYGYYDNEEFEEF